MSQPSYSPSFEEFQRFAAHGNLIPLYREILGDQQIFRPGIGRALENVEMLFAISSRGHRQGCLPDAGRSGNARRKGKIRGVDDQPTGQELLECFTLPNPFLVACGRPSKPKRNPINHHGLSRGESRLCAHLSSHLENRFPDTGIFPIKMARTR